MAVQRSASILRLLAALLLAALLPIYAQGQTTKVRGKVVDVDSGEPIPFAGVFFKGTTTGQSADIDGNFSLETRDPGVNTVVCQLLGYSTLEVEIKNGSFTEVTFRMKLLENELTGSFVKADNRKVRALLANIDRNRERNNPEARPQYRCDIYNKMELDLSHAKEQLKGKRFIKEFGFIFDYIDTSVVSGVPYLPIMISESVAERYHSSSPELNREKILANQISGINKDNNLLSQFTGSMHLRANFYQDFINAMGVNFPSPIQKSGLLYYNYFIIDSLQIDGRKTYQVRYHPKQVISSPTFDGEMMIDAEDFAIRSIHAKMVRGGNVNWLRDIVLDSEYERLADSTWFYKTDKLYADFSIALTDSSKIMSFLGNRLISYSNPDFSTEVALDAGAGPVKVDPDANYKDEAFWDDVRPYKLSEKEKDIYKMVEAIKDQPLYDDIYTTVYTLATGYLDIGPIGIGPYLKLVSFNDLEGFRPQIGIHTSKDLSRVFRWTLYGAYGTKDKQLKGGLTYEHLFSREPTRKLTLDAHYDVFQLGKGKSNFTSGNIISSLWKGPQKLSPMTSFSALYEHEFSQSVNASAELHLKRHYSNAFVPMFDWNGNAIESAASNEAHLQFRFSKDETVNRGHFIKTYIHTYYPIWTIDLTGSVPGLRPGDTGFFKPEVSFDYKLRVPPLGMTRIHFNAGAVLGQVPYPFLHIHQGNVTGLLDISSFSCMDFFEFASDSWMTLFLDHNFHGFFFGKIPLLRKLQLREIFILKAAWGGLSDKNNGTAPEYGALMQFPEGMRAMDKPYVEAGFGISNILRLFRVDFMWRLTHRDTARRDFVTAFGLDLRF